MAVPKGKTTKTRRDSRRSHWKSTPATYSDYGGRQAIEIEVE